LKKLAVFAKEDGQPQYTITTVTIPAFESDDGETIPEYGADRLLRFAGTWCAATRRLGITAGIH
jgi:hypothetical protein